MKELVKILESICNKNDYVLDGELIEKVKTYFDEMLISEKDNFANGRLARNLFDDLVINHAIRVVNIKNSSKDILKKFVLADFKDYNRY